MENPAWLCENPVAGVVLLRREGQINAQLLVAFHAGPCKKGVPTSGAVIVHILVVQATDTEPEIDEVRLN